MDTIAARLTPALPAAIATIAISGPHAVAAAERFVSLSGKGLNAGSLRFGIWGIAPDHRTHLQENAQGSGEQVVLTRPRDDLVEVHCHGGAAVCQALLDDLSRSGCDIVTADQWPSAQSCPLSRAAEEDLQKASTDRAAAVLLDQMNGALRRTVARVRELLAFEVSRLAVAGKGSTSSEPRPGDAAAILTELLQWADFGLHLSQPWKVVLVGPPNVGKSSLLNAIAGTRQAIVHALPGTTRDWLEWSTAIDGWPVVVTDTAGVHSASEPVEQAGIERGLSQLQLADLAILVVDAQQGWIEEHDRLWELLPSRHLIVINKVDLIGTGQQGDGFCIEERLNTCAVDGRGIDVLLASIARKLVPDSPGEGVAVPFREEQVAPLRACLGLIQAGNLDQAACGLLTFLGDDSSRA